MLAALLMLQAGASAPPAKVPAQAVAAPGVIREYVGVWLDEFEGTQFFEGAGRATDLQPVGSAPTLAIDRNAVFTAMMPPAIARERIAALYQPHLYRIRFLGRTDPPGDCRAERIPGRLPSPPPLPGCIGVGGTFPARIETLKVLELADLGPLPAGGQPAR